MTGFLTCPIKERAQDEILHTGEPEGDPRICAFYGSHRRDRHLRKHADTGGIPRKTHDTLIVSPKQKSA